MRILTP